MSSKERAIVMLLGAVLGWGAAGMTVVLGDLRGYDVGLSGSGFEGGRYFVEAVVRARPLSSAFSLGPDPSGKAQAFFDLDDCSVSLVEGGAIAIASDMGGGWCYVSATNEEPARHPPMHLSEAGQIVREVMP